MSKKEKAEKDMGSIFSQDTEGSDDSSKAHRKKKDKTPPAADTASFEQKKEP